jgi:hypothetical protein
MPRAIKTDEHTISANENLYSAPVSATLAAQVGLKTSASKLRIVFGAGVKKSGGKAAAIVFFEEQAGKSWKLAGAKQTGNAAKKTLEKLEELDGEYASLLSTVDEVLDGFEEFG